MLALIMVAGIALLLMVFALHSRNHKRDMNQAQYDHEVLETINQLEQAHDQMVAARQASTTQWALTRNQHTYRLVALLQQEPAYQPFITQLQRDINTDSAAGAQLAHTLNFLQYNVHQRIRADEKIALTNQKKIERIRLVTLCLLSVTLLLFFYTLYHNFSNTQALRRQHAFSMGILQHLPDATATTNPKYELQQWNRPFGQMLWGASANGGTDIRTLLPGWEPADTQVLEQALAQKGSWKKEWQLRTQGTTIVELHVSLLQENSKQQLGTLWVLKDITDRKQQLERLSAKAEKLEINLNSQVQLLQQILHKVPESMFQVDHEGRYLHINRQGAEFLPFEVADVLGKKMWDVFPALRGTGFEKAFRQACTTGTEQFIEFHSPVSAKVYQVVFIPISGMVNIAFRDLSELKKVQSEVSSLSAALVEAREAERRRISAELHDDLGQQLTSNKILLNYLVGLLQLPDGDLLRQFGKLEKQMEAAINTMRHLNRSISNNQLEDLGLSDVLRQDAAQFSRSFGIPVNLEIELADQLPENRVAVALYHIFSEALTNIARHAAAHRVTVFLGLEGGSIIMEVRDDGCGFQQPGNNLGLRSMEERARSMQGHCHISSTPGSGTTVRVKLPLKKD
ncbi:hypothetical protein BUE76_10190 [Cnuella takakiae]|nr:hypothetical protein BUE76_10190 [Cnuella takakiae]